MAEPQQQQPQPYGFQPAVMTDQQQQQYVQQQQQYSQQQQTVQQQQSHQQQNMAFSSSQQYGMETLHSNVQQQYAVSSQPQGLGAGPGMPGVTAGLEYLAQVDQLLVQQQIELIEAFTGFETANKYVVKNSLGQQVYYAVEDTDCCTRQCCGPSRPFDIRILDGQQREVIHLSRPLRCQCCICFCCLQQLEVTDASGTVIGLVKQDWTLLHQNFTISRPDGTKMLKIRGPICACSCRCGDIEFFVMSADGSQEVGKITKQWSGMAKEMFVDADNFGISFPIDLDVNMKATLLGALFLIDFMYFETKQNKEA